MKNLCKDWSKKKKRLYIHEVGGKGWRRHYVIATWSSIDPFLPFGPSEQAIVAHKFVLNLADQIRKPLDLRPEIKRYIVHCYLDIVDDGEVRSIL